MILPLDGDQSTHKINASWALHCKGFELGARAFIVNMFPLAYNTDCVSGAHANAYTGAAHWARVDLSIPDRDQILTAPSSPPVKIPAPSWLHLKKFEKP